MQFVAKAIGPTGQARWITSPKLGGVRTFGPREMADIFESQEAPVAAIGAMILRQPCDGITFTAEPVPPAA
jgi:hypothetical protein